jgi:hypothetical protein
VADITMRSRLADGFRPSRDHCISGVPAMIDNPPPSPPSPEPPLQLKRHANPEKEMIPRESKPEHPKSRTRHIHAT